MGLIPNTIKNIVARKIPGRGWRPPAISESGTLNEVLTGKRDWKDYSADKISSMAAMVDDTGDAKLNIMQAAEALLTNSQYTVPAMVYLAQKVLNTPESSVIEKEDARNYLLHEDGKYLYLGLTPPSGTIEISPYRPTKSKDPNKVYYRYKNFAGASDGNFEEILYSINPSLLKRANGKSKTFSIVETRPFRNTVVDIGRDAKGDYAAYYKKYDYNLPSWLPSEKNAPEFYDRIYLDDAAGFTGDQRGGYWLPEVEVIGKAPSKSKFKQGGKLLPYANYLKSGGIHIKKSNEGKFTEYCGGKVTEECIRRGKLSPSAKVRKRAVFAYNARHKFKH